MLTRDGAGYRYSHENKWIKVNPNDQKDKSVEVRSDFIQNNAVVRPVSYYFINPKEQHAEALAYFRLGWHHRRGLLATNRDVYELVKQQDQQEIDATYPSSNGKSLFVRLPDGKLGRNDDKSCRRIADFEQFHQAVYSDDPYRLKY
jgi:hypothetical protein